MMKMLLTASACMIAFGAQAQDLPAKYAEKGKVVVANTPNYPPMEYRDPQTNELKGLDIELGQAIAKHLGTEIEWSEIGFEQMVSSLNTGRIDIVLSGMSDLPARRESMDFVDYMRSGASTPSTASVCGPSCHVVATRIPVVVRRTLAAIGMDMPPSGTKGRRLKLSITWSA